MSSGFVHACPPIPENRGKVVAPAVDDTGPPLSIGNPRRESAGRASPSLPGSKGCPLDHSKTLLGGPGGKACPPKAGRTPMFPAAAARAWAGPPQTGDCMPHPPSRSPPKLLSSPHDTDPLPRARPQPPAPSSAHSPHRPHSRNTEKQRKTIDINASIKRPPQSPPGH